ncbi:MAG: hypothetical protein ABSD53_25260 [Terriglobales bacterium]
MRAIATLALMAAFLPILVFGQTAQKTSTFTNSDGAFRFVYPADFQICTRAKIDPCNQSYIPVCQPDSFVCVVYPPEQFKDTNFEAASFQVREILTKQEMMTADVCVTPYPQKDGDRISDRPSFLISAKHPVELIAGVQFLHGVGGGAAMSHSLSTDLYRAFRRQRCFELSVSQTETEPNVSDPPMKTLTPAQRKRLDQAMSLILHSFRFSD